ncbi:MAG TPA: hypothetical protein VGE14_06395 [Marmoricola sp.]
MHVLGLVAAERKEPFYNFGGHGHPVSTFQDITVNGQPLLLTLERVSQEHFDVVTALTSEFPSDAVEFLDDVLGIDTKWRVRMGWDTHPDEVPLYFCPLDYDLLCGGIVATIERTDDRVRIHQFRHTSTDERYNEKVTRALRGLLHERVTVSVRPPGWRLGS